ncbi:MAG: hypothetical protein DDT21_01837 [Syntrophomonadaceae bacterium]|nr:hypothetical protein [Bacillota bacterium]
MAVPSINGNAVLTSMATRGQMKFNRQRVGGVTGAGVAVAAGPQSFIWTWSHLTSTELAFWNTTILAGALSITLTAAQLRDDRMNNQTFTSGQLFRPTYESYSAGLFRNVTIEIQHLLPLLLS